LKNKLQIKKCLLLKLYADVLGFYRSTVYITNKFFGGFSNLENKLCRFIMRVLLKNIQYPWSNKDRKSFTMWQLNKLGYHWTNSSLQPLKKKQNSRNLQWDDSTRENQSGI